MGLLTAGPGCCCVACEVFTDEVTRADDTGPGAAWLEVDETWPVVSNAFEPSGAGALLLYNTVITAATSLAVTATINLDTIGDVARLLIGYASGDYYFAQIRVTEDLAFLRLGKVVSGTTTYLSNEAAQLESRGLYGRGEDVKLRVCYADGILRANIFDPNATPPFDQQLGSYQSIAVTLPTDYQVGLATDTQTGTIRFLDASADRCVTCGKQCEVVSDSYIREDVGAALGDNMDVRSGTWAIMGAGAGEYLYTTSSSAVVVYKSFLSEYEDTVNVGSGKSQVVQVTGQLTPGASLQAILAWSSDTRYLYCEWSLSGDGKTETAKLFTRGVFGATQVAAITGRVYPDAQTDIINTFRVCYSGTTLTANFLSGISLGATLGDFYTGMQAGVGTTGNTGTVVVASFDYYLYGIIGAWGPPGVGTTEWSSGACPTCPPVCNVCDVDYPPPQTLTATIPPGLTDGFCDGCDLIAGEYVLQNTGLCCWSYDGPTLCGFSIPGCTPNPAAGHLRIQLCLSQFSGTATWLAFVSLITNASCVDPVSTASARYELAVTLEDDTCQDPPATLPLTSDDWGTTCDGTTPTTIGLSL